MEQLNDILTPTAYSQKLEEKLGKLWSDLGKTKSEPNDKNGEQDWANLFGNIRQMLIKAAREPDFPIDFNFGETSFDVYAKQMTNVDPQGKIKKKIVRMGRGKVVPSNSVLYVFYRAFIQHEEYPFTSSYWQYPTPRRYKLGSGSLSEGFETAMCTMKVGEKSHFILSPEVAYGEKGLPPTVPANAEILLEVELCDVISRDYHSFSDMNCSKADDECGYILKTVQNLHQLANEFFKSGNFICALINYRKAENILTQIKFLNETEEKFRKETLLRMVVNQIITLESGHKTLKRPQDAISAALRAFQHVPAEAAVSVKLKYNLSKIYILLHEKEKAYHLLKEAWKLEPNNILISNLYHTLKEDLNNKTENMNKCWEMAHKKFPQHTTSEQYMAFLRGSVQNDLDNYLDNPLSNMGMPWNYTSEERMTLCGEAKKKNLVYEEYKSHPANSLIAIHKQGSAMLITERDSILHEVKEIVNSEDEEDNDEGFIGWDVEMNVDTSTLPAINKNDKFPADAKSKDEDDICIILDSDEEIDVAIISEKPAASNSAKRI